MLEVDEACEFSKGACLQLDANDGSLEPHRRIEVSEQSYIRALEILDRDPMPAPSLMKLMKGLHCDEAAAGL